MTIIRTIEELDALPVGAVIATYQPERGGSRSYKVAVKVPNSVGAGDWEHRGELLTSTLIDWILPTQLLWPARRDESYPDALELVNEYEHWLRNGRR